MAKKPTKPNPVEFFRDQYREPLSRTRNRTIAHFDKSRSGGVKTHTKIMTTERARRLGSLGARAQRAKMTADQRRVQSMIGGHARVASMSPEEAYTMRSKGGAASWASIPLEERSQRMRAMRLAQLSKCEPVWPFPVGNETVRDMRKRNLKITYGFDRMGSAAKARAKLVKVQRLRKFQGKQNT